MMPQHEQIIGLPLYPMKLPCTAPVKSLLAILVVPGMTLCVKRSSSVNGKAAREHQQTSMLTNE